METAEDKLQKSLEKGTPPERVGRKASGPGEPGQRGCPTARAHSSGGEWAFDEEFLNETQKGNST